MLQVLISNKDATRIQSSGGSQTLKLFLQLVSPSVNNENYGVSVQIKNNGLSSVKIDANIGPGFQIIPTGKTVQVQFFVKGDGVNNLNFRIETISAGDALDIVTWNPRVWRVRVVGENLIPSVNTNFTGWTAFSGASITLTQNQTRTIDYTQYISNGSLVIDDRLNQPSQCSFTLTNTDDTFVIPSREAYVQVYSVQYNRYVFTGFIANDIPKDFVGLNSSTPNMNFQTYRFSIQVSGDEYLLGQKAVPLLPPFVNMGAGQILATLANTLAPGFFDVSSQCLSGDIVPYLEYDPNKNWPTMAKELADQFRYRVRIINKVLYYKPWGDQTFPVSYDETKSQRTFDPFGLKTTIFDSTLVNDAIVIGDAEASDNHSDYFVGDGFTSNFPLRYTVFEGDTSLLLTDDWTSGGINNSQWFVQDPTNVFSTVGALNVNGGTKILGETYIYLRTGLDLGRKVILEHGEFFPIGNFGGNLIPDPDNSNSTWTNLSSGVLVFSPTGGLAGTGGKWTYTGTGTPSGFLATESQLFPVVPGATYTISAYIDARNCQTPGGGQGLPIVGVYNFNLSTAYMTAGQNVGVNGRVSGVFTVPIGVTAVRVIFDNNNITVNNNQTLTYSNPQLDIGSNVTTYNSPGAIIGGVYDNATTFAEVNSSGQCECGFDIRPAAGFSVAISVSGVSGLQIQPRRLGQLVGTPIVTQQNHYYILRTIVNGKSHNRYTSTFKSFTGAIVSGGTNTASADITWVIQDINLNNTNPNQPGFVNIQPPITETRFTLRDQSVPAFAIYCLLNISNANFTLTWTNIFDPPQGSLSVAALTGASGLMLPVLPSNVGTPLDYELGFGLGRQVATIGNSVGNASTDGPGSTLQFYSDSIPGVGSRIRFQAWENRASIARVQDSSSIAKETLVVGDDGKRTAILTDFKPLPRSSEECELAAKAVLLDRTTSLYQGSYQISQAFFDFVNNDFPRSGEFLLLNAPKRNINNLNVVVNSVRMVYKELMSEQVDVTINFGPTKFLENLLATFGEKPNNVLIPKDTASQPTPIQLANIGVAYAGDLDSLRLTGGPVPSFGFDSLNAYFDVGSVPLTAAEVRRTNTGWGINNNDRLGLFTTRTFTMPRTQFDQTWYVRQVNGSFISRRSKAVRIAAPIIPAPPGILSADSRAIQLNFNGDIRNVYGVELRASDNSTVLAQQPVGSIQDLYFDVQALPVVRSIFQGKNILLYSDMFNVTGGWVTQNGCSVSGNQIASPLGNVTADLLSGGNQLLAGVKQSFTAVDDTYTYSVYVRSGTGSTVDIGIFDTVTNTWVPANLLIISGPGDGSTVGGSIATAGLLRVSGLTSAWTRVSITTSNHLFGKRQYQCYVFPGSADTPNLNNIYAWGAQLELTSAATTYFANAGSPIIPRNLLTATEEFDNSIWSKDVGVTILANQAMDPFGMTQSANRVFYDGSGSAGQFRIYQTLPSSVTPPNGTPMTISFWAKSVSGSQNLRVVNNAGFSFTPVPLTTSWQRFTATCISDGSSLVQILIHSAAGNNASFATDLWGMQLEYGESATPYVGVVGNNTINRPFYAYFFNTMWEYSQPLLVAIGVPIAPVLTLGNKFSNLVETRLDAIARGDIKNTTYQISTDSTFVTGVIQTVGSAQPATMSVTVPNSAGSAFSARAKRTDFFGDGPWSATLNIPYGVLISSNWAVGQGSIPPTLDNQAAALFTYTSSADSGGGANTGTIAFTWPTFIIAYADNTQQVVGSGSQSTGKTLTSSTSATTPYYFYPRLQANIPGAAVQFVGSPIAHASKSNSDAQLCVADGYVALGGSALSMTAFVPVSPGSGGPSGGGGGDGGSSCILEDEVTHTPNGEKIAIDLNLNDMLSAYDINENRKTWNYIFRIGRGEEQCVKVILENGKTSKGFSKSTSVPIWKKVNGKLEPTAVYGKDLTCQFYMMDINCEIHQIKEIIDLGYKKVILIELKPQPLFFAGDLLSHNGIVLPK